MAQTVKKKHYYRLGDTISVEEDSTHEFKGHRNLACEEIPIWARGNEHQRPSRKAVSRSLNAFLNTGTGGTAYLGITDQGLIVGLKLTFYQKDHVVESLQDLFSRYKPTVLPHRYKVKFVPVVGKNCTDDEVVKLVSQSDFDYADTSQRDRPHYLRTDVYCWCDKDACSQINMGVLAPDYVIEIKVKPWNPTDPRNTDGVGTLVNLNPIHEDEESNVYLRRQASTTRYLLHEIDQLSRQQVKDACDTEIYRLKKELSLLKLAGSEKMNSDEVH